VEEASKSGQFLREKRTRLDIEDIVPTPTAVVNESNVEDRSVFRFPLLFGIASLQINV